MLTAHRSLQKLLFFFNEISLTVRRLFCISFSHLSFTIRSLGLARPVTSSQNTCATIYLFNTMWNPCNLTQKSQDIKMDQNTSLQEISKKTSHFGKRSHLKFFQHSVLRFEAFCFSLQTTVGFSNLSDAKLKTI